MAKKAAPVKGNDRIIAMLNRTVESELAGVVLRVSGTKLERV